MIFLCIEMKRLLLFLILLLSPFGGLYAEVYKWVDDEGHVYYGDRPPPDAEPREVEIAPGPDKEQVRHAKERAKQLREYLHAIDRERVGKEASKALLPAIEAGDGEYVLSLLKRGADPNMSDPFGRTALMYAGINGQTRVVMKTLIEMGAEVNTKSSDGTTALIASVIFGDPLAISLLLKHGVEVNTKDGQGDTALAWAKGRWKNASPDRSFHPNMQEKNQYGDYNYCTKKEFAEVIRILREAGATE